MLGSKGTGLVHHSTTCVFFPKILKTEHEVSVCAKNSKYPVVLICIFC